MKQADEERRKTKNKQIRQTDRKMERNKKREHRKNEVKNKGRFLFLLTSNCKAAHSSEKFIQKSHSW
jgi:hypothetical protein